MITIISVFSGLIVWAVSAFMIYYTYNFLFYKRALAVFGSENVSAPLEQRIRLALRSTLEIKKLDPTADPRPMFAAANVLFVNEERCSELSDATFDAGLRYEITLMRYNFYYIQVALALLLTALVFWGLPLIVGMINELYHIYYLVPILGATPLWSLVWASLQLMIIGILHEICGLSIKKYIVSKVITDKITYDGLKQYFLYQWRYMSSFYIEAHDIAKLYKYLENMDD